MTTTDESTTPFDDDPDPRLREAWSWLVEVSYIPRWDQGGMVERGMATSGNLISMMDQAYEGGWTQFTIDVVSLEEWNQQSVAWYSWGHAITEKSNFGRTRTRQVLR